jgi:cell wall-associated NlpC family hydrolase
MAGAEVPPGAEAPGDLIFWRGHVALVSAPGMILHANAHHMAVAEEPLGQAEARIAAAGTPVLRRLRPG